ncbi:helix-turn-helix domain-containing protein [Enterococcus dispar]|uniref:helix-turn-helix domain-containing protein n=1 Tax=Enterococcus dispar TaxID=44009 RepID=UPI00289258AE|nr:helix-turn-helix domain-containing protein [Enterococcus dispar]MDT2705729.1 helix-turn-helix domain-containing protein [Enterococcus dispar]
MNTTSVKNFIREYLDYNLSSLLVSFVPRRYLTQRQAVRYTGTSPATINGWVKEGLRVVQLTENGHWKYDIKDLDKWMEKHKI